MFPLCIHDLSASMLLWYVDDAQQHGQWLPLISSRQFIAKIPILIPIFFHLKFLSFLKIPHKILLIICYVVG